MIFNTVAAMDCSFELDSLFYKCSEINDFDENGSKIRVAFTAVSYHCG
jgi:hypothetical protein